METNSLRYARPPEQQDRHHAQIQEIQAANDKMMTARRAHFAAVIWRSHPKIPYASVFLSDKNPPAGAESHRQNLVAFTPSRTLQFLLPA
jgi:hypothetical protein